MRISKFFANLFSPNAKIEIEIKRDGEVWRISPEKFEEFGLQDGDKLRVLAPPLGQALPVTWGDTNVPIAPGKSIRVPEVYKTAEFNGFEIPHHLVTLTGAGPETLESFGKAHIEKYEKYLGMFPDMTIIDLGCGIGRDAVQLFDYLGPNGRYIGIDVTRDSIVWCTKNITAKYPKFSFHHCDAVSELYNPFGSITSMDYRFPVPDASVDRIVLASVFTHLLENEVTHYLHEFRRVLKPGGLVYASFFLYTQEALEAAKEGGNTSWKATFKCEYGNGVFGNDPDYPRGAVAYTDEAFQRMLNRAGLKLVRPYLKGWWSGLHGDQAEDGQDAAILRAI